MSEKFVPGEPQKPLRVSTFAGGPGLRAASVAQLLGAQTLAVAFAGGRIGELLQDALDRQDIPHILTRTVSETRGGFLLLDKETGIVTMIPETAPAITELETAKLYTSLNRHLPSSTYLIVTGNDDGDAEMTATAVVSARAAKVPVIADLKGESLASALEVGDIFLLRVGHKALQRYLERSLSHDSALVREANALRETHRIAHIVITLGEDGAILVNGDGAWRVQAQVVSHFNPVGGGQTLVGALAARLTQNEGDVLDALRYGAAAASVNVTHDEPGYATPAEVAILLKKTTAVVVQTR